MTRYSLWLFLLLIPNLSQAHHSNAGYDFDTVEEVKGELVSVSWRNPHVRLVLKAAGSGEEWELEAQDINSLGRRGLSPELLEVGDSVTVAGHPSRRTERILYVTNVLLPSGVEIRTRGESTQPRFSEATLGFDETDVEAARAAVAGQRGIFRVWMIDTPDPIGRDVDDFPLTATARAAQEAWDPAENLVLKCIASGMPSAAFVGSPHPIEFVEGEGLITYRSELFDIVRTIHMAPDSGIEPEPPSALGYSVGHWEGETLVVETTQIDWPYLDPAGSVPQSDKVSAIERYSVDEQNDQLNFSMTIIDPDTLIAPLTVERTLEWRPDLVIESYGCQLTE
jgi:hypothetical protein